MSNLLASEFSRLFNKNKVFRITLFLTIGCSLFSVLTQYILYRFSIAETPSEMVINLSVTMDYYLNILFLYIVVPSSALISTFIGREFGDGTIRNKLTAGYTRTQIYISDFIVCFTGQVIIHAAYAIIIVIMSLLLVDGFDSSPQMILKIEALDILIIAVYTSIFTLVSMLSDSKARAVTTSMIIAVVLLILGEAIHMSVMPETIKANLEDQIFHTILTKEEATEYYREKLESEKGKDLEGVQRTVYMFLDDILPVCQSAYLDTQITYLTDEDPIIIEGIDEPIPSFKDIILFPTHAVKYVVYDLIIIIVLNIVGIQIFRRRDLK